MSTSVGEERSADVGAAPEGCDVALAKTPRHCRKDGAHAIIQSMSVWIEAQRPGEPRTEWPAAQVAPAHRAGDILDAVRSWADARWV